MKSFKLFQSTTTCKFLIRNIQNYKSFYKKGTNILSPNAKSFATQNNDV